MKTYRDIAGDGGSDIIGQVTEREARKRARMAPIARKFAVMSGKGGVGKSMVTANLAAALALQGHRVGILDADINGPCIAAMLGVRDQALALAQIFKKPVEAVAVYDPDFHYVAFHGIAGVLSPAAASVFRFEEQEKLHEEIIDSGLARSFEPALDQVAEVSVAWTSEAEARIERVPEFVRGVVRRAVIRHAVERGHTVITSDVINSCLGAMTRSRLEGEAVPAAARSGEAKCPFAHRSKGQKRTPQ